MHAGHTVFALEINCVDETHDPAHDRFARSWPRKRGGIKQVDRAT